MITKIILTLILVSILVFVAYYAISGFQCEQAVDNLGLVDVESWSEYSQRCG